MNDNKLVSVIIPTYKRPDTLKRAIESVLMQSYKNIEVVIVDDNNPNTEFREATEEYMKMYEKDSRVIYIKHDKNKERSAARNTGIRNARGEYLMFLDNDDEFCSTKVESQVRNLNGLDEHWGMNYTKYIRKNGEKKVAVSAENRSGGLLIEALKRNLFIHAGSNLMIRRSVIEDIGEFNESISTNEDIEFIARVLTKYKLAYVDDLGLIVHVGASDDVNFEEITKNYLESISGLLNQLSELDQDKVLRMINLQIFRSKLQNHLEINAALRMIKQKNVLLVDAIKYMAHLIYRKASKKSYGFVLKNM